MKIYKRTKYEGWYFSSKHLKVWDDGFTLFGFHLGWIHPWCHDAKAFGHPHRIYITIPKVGNLMVGLPSRRDAVFDDDDGVDLNAKVPWHIAGTCKWSEKKQRYVSANITWNKWKKRPVKVEK